MKYLLSKFRSPANSQAYVDGWDRTFGAAAAWTRVSGLETPPPAVPELPTRLACPKCPDGEMEQCEVDWCLCRVCGHSYFGTLS